MATYINNKLVKSEALQEKIELIQSSYLLTDERKAMLIELAMASIDTSGETLDTINTTAANELVA